MNHDPDFINFFHYASDHHAVAKTMKRSIAVLYVILAFALMCGLVFAYSESFDLLAGDSITRNANANEGDRISGRLIVVGQDAFNFSVSDPDDAVVLSDTIAGPKDFQFTVNKTGTYTFHFENLYSGRTIRVTFNYDVQRYIFGFPQEFIILFAIVGVALIGIVVFVAMSPKA